MEYTQWVKRLSFLKEDVEVLILVVMEYTQWAQPILMQSEVRVSCLNPCCNGIYSMRYYA